MLKNENVLVQYEGDFIRIGVSKKTGKTYIHVIEDTNLPALWFRFEPEYYTDYEEYLQDYRNYVKQTESTFPDLHYQRVLDGETLDHYIGLFSPQEVFINNECVYSTVSDVSYTKEKYAEDMSVHMIPNKYYPFIREVNISVDESTQQFKLNFSVVIKYKEY